MARRRRRNGSVGRNAVVTVNASPRLLRPHVMRKSPRLVSIEDRRRYHPLRADRPTFTVAGRKTSRLGLSAPRTRPGRAERAWLANKLKFHNPKKVVTCVRRKSRKEVLFAKGVGGRKGKKRPPKRNWRSEIKC